MSPRTDTGTPRRISTRVVVVVGLLVALVLASVVSFYASGSPDGLARVAEEQGITAAEQEHAAGDGPMADYRTRGVEDDRLSGALAGVAGALLVLVLAGGLVLVVRRRGSGAADEPGTQEPRVDALRTDES